MKRWALESAKVAPNSPGEGASRLPRNWGSRCIALALVVASQFPVCAASPSEDPLLTELPKAEGADLIAPYELWIATFEPGEGSYGSGPRILIITNDRKTAIANVQGHRTELAHSGRVRWQCEPGGTMADTYRARGVSLKTRFTTYPGEEACWVEGTVSVSVGRKTRTFRVKGASGL